MPKTIIAVTKIDKENKVYHLVRAVADTSNPREVKWQFNGTRVAENKLKEVVMKMPTAFINVTVENGKIKGKEASLDRFTSNKKTAPVVILSVIKDLQGNTLGYKVATSTGAVRNVKNKELLAMCEKIVAIDEIPIQNAMYVPVSNDNKVAHIKAYPNTPFLLEVYDRGKNKYTDKRQVDIKENEKKIKVASESKEEVKNPFTKEQMEQLKLGMEHGVDIKIYGNPALSAAQMKELRTGLESGLPVKLYAFPDYDLKSMRAYRDELEAGVDIREFLSPKYSFEQIAVLSLAKIEGVRIDSIADPSLSVNEMEERLLREQMRVWIEQEVPFGGTLFD